MTANRCSPAFADYLLEVAIRYPQAETIHLVLDNLSSHTRRAVVQRFGEKAGGWLWDRFTVHYTPRHGSWLNQAEIAISLFSRQCLGRRRIGDRASLRRDPGLGPSYEPPSRSNSMGIYPQKGASPV